MSAPAHLVANRYRLVEPLGQGGMGRVWKARDEVLHRDVAIKELVPPPGLTEDERREMRERSLREARAIARLSNINVVRVFDVLRTDGDPWIVMEYVPSRSLQDVLATTGPVAPGRAVEIGLGMLSALRAAHRSGIVHRDVKPGNVLLGDDGRVVLTDFGLATVPGDPTVTRTGLVLGSPAYIAPERAKDGSAGPEADLWSLGATLYAAVEGQSPYARTSAMATLAALATEPPPVPKNAGPLKPLLTGLLRKDPAERLTIDDAERLLQRAAGRRLGGRLLDGRRRPSPFGRREPRPPIVPLPRTPMDASGDVPASPGAAVDRVSPAPPAPVSPTPSAPVSPAELSPPVSAALVTPVPATKGVASVPVRDGATEDEERDRADSAKRRRWLLGALAALLVLALVVLVLALQRQPSGDGGRQPNAGPTTGEPNTSTTAPATPATSSPEAAGTTVPPQSATPAPGPNQVALPAGWRMYKDRTGFSVPAPAGWTVSRESTRVRIQEPNGRRLLMIDQTDRPKADPVADWKAQEPYRAARLRDYQRVGEIHAVDYRGWEAADWEWTYTTSSGTRLHVRNRNVITAPDKAYAIYWSTPDSAWVDNLDEFDLIARGFVPVRG
jgi:serine/threonine protein kinase